VTRPHPDVRPGQVWEDQTFTSDNDILRVEAIVSRAGRAWVEDPTGTRAKCVRGWWTREDGFHPFSPGASRRVQHIRINRLRTGYRLVADAPTGSEG